MLGVTIASLVLTLAASAEIEGAGAANGAPQEETRRRLAPRPLTIGEALRAAYYANPDLLNSEDFLLAARVNEHAVGSNYLPQVTPFIAAFRSSESGIQSQAYGVTATQQFTFGTLLEGSAIVTRAPPGSPDALYGSNYFVSLRQPLLRGADPVVAREPLYLAGRLTQDRARALEIQKRRMVLLIYRTYLAMAREEEVVRLSEDRLEQARKLTRFSQARFLAGSISRLDVLRSEQQEASAAVARNDADNRVYDLRDQLRRSAGLRADFEFSIQAPRELPVEGPHLAEALAGVAVRRPEALEAADRVKDARLSVRIAKSLELPSLDGVLSYEAIGNGSSVGNALPARSSSFLFGFRSSYGLNGTVLHAQRRQAEIELEVRTRNLEVLLGDINREVGQDYRRLSALRANYRVASENVKVAEMQAKVARLRFEKGLSSNFDAVDADNLLNAARLFEVDSRFSILLAELDCFYASGHLNLGDFLQQP